MSLVREDHGSVVLIRPRGDLDLQMSRPLRQLFETLEEEGHQLVVIDLGETSFIDSAALTLFVSSAIKLRKHGGDLKLAAVPEALQRVFHLVRMQDFLDIYGDWPTAIAAFPTG